MSRRQGIFWMLTVPANDFDAPTELPEGIKWMKGQKECGNNTSYLHYQIVVAFAKKKSLAQVKTVFPNAHAELTKSSQANEYVWKEDTRVEGSQFELGAKPICRNSKPDWEKVWEAAKQDKIMEIPASIRIVSYKSLKAIAADYDKPKAIVRNIKVFWGLTGVGKSRKAWEEAGEDAYCKDPRTKFWCGYRGEENVIIDEFRGGIDIAHMLRWLDRYPVRIEKKGTSAPLVANNIWITSNLEPRMWYPEVDYQTLDALLRRLNITEFT